MNKKEFLRPSYDAIVIGASLATLSSALELAKLGHSVLVLERHNLPGGCAQSYVRGGIELDASLHEMMGIGSPTHPQYVRKYLEENGIFIDWKRIDIAYTYVSPRVTAKVRSGVNGDYSMPIEDIVHAVHGDDALKESLKRFFAVCDAVYWSGNQLIYQKLSKISMYVHHKDFVTTIGYSTQEIFDYFKFPPQVQEILGAYWTYMGSPLDDLPFSIYGTILAGYVGYGPYLPKKTSFEMSLKLAEVCESKGVQIEYGQHVEKILVRDGRVEGVHLSDGTEIKAPRVVSGAYPNTVYSSMIEPSSAVPGNAHRWANSLPLGVTCFSVTALFDLPPEKLGIKDYCLFVSNAASSRDAFDKETKDQRWPNLTITCPNLVFEDASPDGTCVYNMVVLPSVSAFSPTNEEEYLEFKYRHAREMIEMESKRLGVNLFEHILELSIETPVTIASYLSSYKGCVYGYRHTMENHPAARALLRDDSMFIKGLAFAGAHQICGDGMAPAFDNGKAAVIDLLSQEKKRR